MPQDLGKCSLASTFFEDFMTSAQKIPIGAYTSAPIEPREKSFTDSTPEVFEPNFCQKNFRKFVDFVIFSVKTTRKFEFRTTKMVVFQNLYHRALPQSRVKYRTKF